MKRVYLVDDEILIRESIRSCINWEREGFEYCGDASDGEMALPDIEKLKPDILITDIRMPFMDGLELSAIVRQKLPDTKIVILSGHDEFEYARQALRIGVIEYCLKPFGSSDIVKLLRQISADIDRESLEKQWIEQLMRNAADNHRASQNELLVRICNGSITYAEAAAQANQLGVELLARYYAIVITDIRLKDNQSFIPSDLVQRAEQLLTDFLANRIRYIDYKRNHSERVWLLQGETTEQLLTVLEELGDTARQWLQESLPFSIVIGTGSIQERLHTIHNSYIQADEDRHWRRLSGQNKRMLLDLSALSPDQAIFLDRSEFIAFLKIGRASEADAYIQGFAAALKEIQWQTTLYGYYLLNDLTLEVIREALKLYRNIEASEHVIESLQDKIGSIRSWIEACDYLKSLTHAFWQWRSGSAARYGEMVERVKEYVKSQYSNDQLSLQDAADHVCVSPSHISKVFSQVTGQTFIEYVMETRIRKAMELLHASNSKSYEIAFQVGYKDPHYFSNLFKKVTGMNIREFRKQGQILDLQGDAEEG